MGRLSLLQWIFLTQESNRDLLHFRQILYQLSYQGAHASKVILKILQVRLQQYMNHELPNVQTGFQKGGGIRNQIADICWIIEKVREFQKNIYLCFIDYAKVIDCVDHNKLWKILQEMGIPPALPPEKSVCRSGRNS